MAADDGLVEQPPIQNTAPTPTVPTKSAPVDLPIPSSESFTFEAVNSFLCSKPATIVVLLGDRDSGKSTLICSIYDRFLHGPFASCKSCGIRTVTGLERRAHLERVNSGRGTPDTQHTSIAEGLQYFHFPVVAPDLMKGRHDLFISDRAGELYKNARANSALVPELTEVPSADYLLILLDGARLAEPETRTGAFYAVRQSLQMLLDSGAIDHTFRVQVVTTKLDLVQKSSDVVVIEDLVKTFEARTRADFGIKLNALEFYSIAARDPELSLKLAYGVDALLHAWLGGPRDREGIAPSPVEVRTEFDKLAGRPSETKEPEQ